MEPTSRPQSASAGVLCVGLATLDIIQLVERVPRANEKVAALDFLLAAGGPATNAAVAAAWCGARADLVTALPEHPLSALILKDLRECGVSVTVGGHYPGPPVTASITVTRGTGERSVVSPTSAVASVTPIDSPLAVEKYGALLMDGYFPEVGLPVARAARERGIPVILDAGSLKPHTADAVRASQCVVASADFAPDGTDGSPEEVFDYLEAAGVTYAAITRGQESILYRVPGGQGEVEVATVGVADTLGAGDFFHGALAAAVAQGGLNDETFAAHLAQASAVAGRSLSTFGTRAWLATPR